MYLHISGFLISINIYVCACVYVVIVCARVFFSACVRSREFIAYIFVNNKFDEGSESRVDKMCCRK